MLAYVLGAMMLLGPATDPGVCEALKAAVQTGGPRVMRPAVANAPATCATAIAPLLDVRGEVAFSAAWALAFMGSADGQDALYSVAKRRPHFRLTAAAAVGAGVLARPADLDFLCQIVATKGRQDEWPAVEAAALSIGLIGWSGCNEALHRVAKEEGTLTGAAARRALDTQASAHPCRTGPSPSTDQLLKTVLDCGIPSSDRAPAFFDVFAESVWMRSADGWVRRPASDEERSKLPKMVLSPWFAKARDRAIVEVALWFGPVDAIGYDYLLLRDGESWVIRGVRRTLIA
jgi:hypothetical protein